MKHQHHTVSNGTISHEGQSYPIVDGVVDCPRELGEHLHLKPIPDAQSDGLRTDGPTLEEFVKAGYEPPYYPPRGYAEKPSPALTAYREELARAAAAVEAAKAAEDARAKELAETLKGSVADIAEALEKISDVAYLAALEAMESGKERPRKGVLDAIAERREEILTAPPL